MRAVLALVITLACFGASCRAGGQAAVMTGIGLAFSAARRADGDCYVDCRPPRACNRSTGLCEVPCGGCEAGEVCGPEGFCVGTSFESRTATAARTIY